LNSAKELSPPAFAMRKIVSSRMIPTSMMPRIAVRPVDTRTPMYVTPRRTSTMMATSSQYGGAKWK